MPETIARLFSTTVARYFSPEIRDERFASAVNARICSLSTLEPRLASAISALVLSVAMLVERLLSAPMARICSALNTPDVVNIFWTRLLMRELVSFRLENRLVTCER